MTDTFEPEAWDGDYCEFLSDVAEDAHLESAYESQFEFEYLPTEEDLLEADRADYEAELFEGAEYDAELSRWDDDPSPYSGDYSEM